MHDTFTVDFEELDKIAVEIHDEVCLDDWDYVVDMVHGVQELSKDQTEDTEDRLNAWLKYIMHICNHMQIEPEPEDEPAEKESNQSVMTGLDGGRGFTEPQPAI